MTELEKLGWIPVEGNYLYLPIIGVQVQLLIDNSLGDYFYRNHRIRYNKNYPRYQVVSGCLEFFDLEGYPTFSEDTIPYCNRYYYTTHWKPFSEVPDEILQLWPE